MLNAGRPPEIRVDRPFLLYFEMTLYIILLFIALCAGMALSVYAFGTGGKRKRIFQDIYFSVEDTNGVGVLYTKTGEYSAILKIENPVQKYCANIDSYYEFTHLFTALAQTLGDLAGRRDRQAVDDPRAGGAAQVGGQPGQARGRVGQAALQPRQHQPSARTASSGYTVLKPYSTSME